MSYKVILRDSFARQKLEEICEDLFERFKKQMSLQFTNDLKKQSERIEELESEKPCFKIRFGKLKNKTYRTNKKSKTWNNTEDNCASGLKEFQLRRLKQVTKF